MASSIHHGAPGSFKSFTLVQRFAIDALLQGRIVVTNIRGLTSLDRILDQFPELEFPASAGLIYIHTELSNGRAIMARWFHWVPFRALILMDEGQRIYPDRNDFKLEKLDNPMSPDGYEIEELHVQYTDDYTGEEFDVHRPEDVFTAFDMQRHFQWDIFISTTHINKIKTDIRESSQTAYYHKSLSGKIPFLFKGTWYEFQHHPSNAGLTASQQIGKPRKYKADPRIYKCYRSTATGEHTESKADQSILSDSSVRIKLAAIALSICFGVFMVFKFADVHGTDKKTVAVSAAPVVENHQAVPVPVLQTGIKDSDHGPVTVPVQQDSDIFSALLGFRPLMVAFHDVGDKLHAKLTFNVETKDGIKVVPYSDLRRQGFNLVDSGLCVLSLIAPNGRYQLLTCDSPEVFCSANLETASKISRHSCHKYGEIEQTVNPQNALVTAASNTFSSR